MNPLMDWRLATADEAANTVRGGAVYMADVERRLVPYLECAAPQQRPMAYLCGLLSPAERKNSWQLAEVSGDAGDANAGLVIDKTGFLKKGRHSAGVVRQYNGTTGRIDNCQSGMFVAHASRHGQDLLGRELYLLRAWPEDPGHCRQAGIPEERRFATTPPLAQAMLQRVLAAGVPASRSEPGRTGAVGIKPSPNITITHVGKR